MKYIANPVEVDAFVIIGTNAYHPDIDVSNSTQSLNNLWIELEDGRKFDALNSPLREMTARMWPKVGDYWVVQSDGYIYLNPKDVFERKYRMWDPKKRPTIEELQAILDSEENRPVTINRDGSITVT